jgi:asparagine synthetase B (glutamine-hydrolysing)
MPDFLISLGPTVDPDALLALLRRPYGQNAPQGEGYAFPWGAVAVLEDRIAGGTNLVRKDGLALGWAGELLGFSGSVEASRALSDFAGPISIESLRRSGFLEKLNGAFALFCAGKDGLAVITDPMASVQLYRGTDLDGHIVALGTHPDLVAALSGDDYQVDPVSVADFLNNGIPCCPYTMHGNVREMAPGTVFTFTSSPEGLVSTGKFQYFVPPGEARSAADQAALVPEFVARWKRAVLARCQGGKVAVQLSGGMDSRLVLACIPPEVECLAVTLCDSMNREARFARRVAKCYNRQWIPLQRDAEYLGRTAKEAIRFTGCEGEWHHGHTIGFADRLNELNVHSVFTGLLMDNNFKGYYARDFVRNPRYGGLLPPSFHRKPCDYPNEISGFCRQHLRRQCVEEIIERRAAFVNNHFASNRESACEWFDGYPYSQACDNTGWVIERRVMPMRLPVMDRALLDLAFRTPMSLKAGGRFFDQAIVHLLGPGLGIPSANDGVRPGSGHVGRLLQRAVRKLENNGRKFLGRAGFELRVPHSWHDFPRYLRESVVLGDLIQRHASRLQEFEGSIFQSNPVQMLSDATIPWNIRYRLIQLATWRSLLDTYRP